MTGDGWPVTTSELTEYKNTPERWTVKCQRNREIELPVSITRLARLHTESTIPLNLRLLTFGGSISISISIGEKTPWLVSLWLQWAGLCVYLWLYHQAALACFMSCQAGEIVLQLNWSNLAVELCGPGRLSCLLRVMNTARLHCPLQVESSVLLLCRVIDIKCNNIRS